MTRFPLLKEGYVLALLPLIGITVVAVHQMGTYSFYGVPLEYLELDTVKIILSALALALYGAASTYAIIAICDQGAVPTLATRLGVHLSAAVLLSMPFWIKNMSLGNDISWSTILFIGFCASVTFGADYQIRKLANREEKTSIQTLIGTLAGTGFFVTVLVLVATFAHGYLTAKDMVTRTFIENTNLMLVSRVGDSLVTKEYDPKTSSINKAKTTIVVVDKTMNLVTRDAAIADQ